VSEKHAQVYHCSTRVVYTTLHLRRYDAGYQKQKDTYICGNGQLAISSPSHRPYIMSQISSLSKAFHDHPNPVWLIWPRAEKSARPGRINPSRLHFLQGERTSPTLAAYTHHRGPWPASTSFVLPCVRYCWTRCSTDVVPKSSSAP